MDGTGGPMRKFGVMLGSNVGGAKAGGGANCGGGGRALPGFGAPAEPGIRGAPICGGTTPETASKMKAKFGGGGGTRPGGVPNVQVRFGGCNGGGGVGRYLTCVPCRKGSLRFEVGTPRYVSSPGGPVSSSKPGGGRILPPASPSKPNGGWSSPRAARMPSSRGNGARPARPGGPPSVLARLDRGELPAEVLRDAALSLLWLETRLRSAVSTLT